MIAAAIAAMVVAAGAAAAADRPGGAAPDPKRAEIRAKLERSLDALSAELPGASAYLLRDLTTGETIEARAGAVFPAASIIKLPILLELFKQAEEGTRDLAREVPVDPEARVEGGGVLEKWSPPYPPLSADHLAVLMIDFSDNYATNLLIDAIGMERVDRRLRAWGLGDTLLRRKMMDLETARAGRENVTTARDMVALLTRLHRGDLLGADGTRRAIAILKRNEGTPIKRGLPAAIEAADKDGELEGVRGDAGIVYVPGRPFAICVLTSYLREQAAGERYIAAVTRSAWEYFATLAGTTEYGRAIGP